MTDNADDCWRLIELRPEWAEHANRHLPLGECMAGICGKVAADLSNCQDVDFADFVGLVALFRIHNEISRWIIFRQEGAFELIAYLLSVEGPVRTVLSSLGLMDDFKAWLVSRQLDRQRRDPAWQMAWCSRSTEDEDGLTEYLAMPLKWVTGCEMVSGWYGEWVGQLEGSG